MSEAEKREPFVTRLLPSHKKRLKTFAKELGVSQQFVISYLIENHCRLRAESPKPIKRVN